MDPSNPTVGSPTSQTYEHRPFHEQGSATATAAVKALAQLSPSSSHNASFDPYEVNSGETLHLLDAFFSFQKWSGLLLFPKGAFIGWVRGCRHKQEDELMLLNAVLALGSSFSAVPFGSSFAKLCAEHASRTHCRLVGKFTLTLVQTRLILSWYHLLQGDNGIALDVAGSARHAASALNLHTEQGCSIERLRAGRERQHDFGFSALQIVECKRRTLWAVFCYGVRLLVNVMVL